MFDSYPESIVVDRLTKHDVMRQIAIAYDNNELINVISDKELLDLIEKEVGIRLEVPERVVDVKIERGEKAFIFQKKGKRYTFYEVMV